MRCQMYPAKPNRCIRHCLADERGVLAVDCEVGGMCANPRLEAWYVCVLCWGSLGFCEVLEIG